MKVGFMELLVVFFVALLVLGPDKLPGYAKKLGEALSAFRKASDEATREIRENIVEPLEEAQKPLREAMEPLEELDRSVREVQTSLRDVGKRKPSAPAQTDGTEAKQEPERNSEPKQELERNPEQKQEPEENPEPIPSGAPIEQTGGPL